MIFASKHPGAIYIQKKSLDFYVEGEKKHLEFPAETVSDEGIIDPAGYEKIIEDFIVAGNIKKQQMMLILSEEVLFEKSIPLSDVKLTDEKLADFTEMIPVENEKLVKKSIRLDENIQFFALNKQLFEKIVEILDRSGFEVLAIVPLILYSPDNTLDENLIKKICQDKQLLKKADFLSNNLSADNTSKSKKFLAIIMLLVLIIFILSFLLAGAYFKLPLPYFKKAVKPTPIIKKATLKTSPVPAATESAAPKISTRSAVLSRDKLRVSVLNGTGIAGQAVKVKDLLSGLGLSEIATDNAQGAYTKETVVIFSPAVADDLQEEITSALAKSFETVSSQKSIASQSADIIITTGKPKNSP